MSKIAPKPSPIPSVHDLSLVVPIVTMSKIEKEEIRNLAAAIESGVGIAGFHGGAGDSFRECVEYQFIIGGQWVAHPGNIIDYTVNITRPDDPIMESITDFAYTLGAVLHACRPVERGAGDDDFYGRLMPIGSTAW